MATVAPIASVHRLTPSRADGVRLYCFPFAGGSAPSYRPLAALLPKVDLHSFQLPGRQERIREPAVVSLRSIVPGVVETIAADADGTPFGLFGHSMGATLAYEVAVALAAAGVAMPALLSVSGRRPPHVVDPDFVPYHTMPDAAFSARIEALGGIPPEVLKHRDLFDLMLPTLRADFTAAETYVAAPGSLLSCPIAVFGGNNDPESPPSTLPLWAELTTALTSVHTYDGDHFFIWDHAADIASVIEAGLCPATPEAL